MKCRFTFGVVFVIALMGSATHAQVVSIPSHCKAPGMAEIVSLGVPEILELSPGAADVSAVEFLADVPKVVAYPAIGRAPARHMLKCPVKLTWSNGHTDFGSFAMWEDPYQQIMMSFEP